MRKKLMRVLSIILTFLMLAPLMFVGVVQVNADTAVDYSPYIQDGKVMGVPEPGTVIEKGTVFGGDKLTGNEAMLFDIRPFVEMFDADNYETGGAYIEAGSQYSIDSVQYADATKGFVVKDSYIKEIYGKQTVCVRLYPKVAPVGIEELAIKLDWKKVGFELGKQITIEEGLISSDKYPLDGEYRYLAIKSAEGTWRLEWEMEDYTLNETDSYAIYYAFSLGEIGRASCRERVSLCV